MSSRKCKLCAEKGQTWPGDPPKCSFESGSFDGEGWNCWTAGLIRDVVYEGQSPMPSRVDYRYCEDQKYATIQIDDMDIGALALWVSWYKNRGRTDAMLLLFSDQPPRPPTEDECIAIAITASLNNLEQP